MIDLRSDTLTKPTDAMREAMFRAPVGDDVYGEDPSINELEARGAELLGHEAALFCVSGSLANLLGVWLVAERGSELVCDEQAHIVRAEVGAHAALHGIQTRTWASPDGVADPAVVERIVADRAAHLVATGGVELENTHNFGGGTIQPVESMAKIAELCRDKGLGLHLDGARLANAAVALGRPLSDWSKLATSASLCLSKGLGAPVGTVLASSRTNIARARAERKRLGGGWRQAGILAAAGLYALDHHIDRLADDHAHARLIADIIRAKAPGAVAATVPTNIVVVTVPDAAAVVAGAKEQGVLVSLLNATTVRLVTHLDVTEAQCREGAEVVAELLA
ncbi:MAG: low specificity L-threonine aldolase [Propionibacteriaceae bacterium]|nr:low specificity L-threonine aldolase [Propionibacteriaceae bacterium]